MMKTSLATITFSWSLLTVLLCNETEGFVASEKLAFARFGRGRFGTTNLGSSVLDDKSLTWFSLEEQWNSPSFDSAESGLQQNVKKNHAFEELYKTVNVGPKDLLRLEEREDFVRGLYLTNHVQAGDAILSVPLSHCLRDDQPPDWFLQQQEEQDSGYYNPGEWVTRLAANLIEKQLKLDEKEEAKISSESSTEEANNKVTELWFSLLPNPDFLRASLPIHWSTSVLQSARCTALELAVDSAFFARAQAVEDLMYALKGVLSEDDFIGNYDGLRRVCEDALDVIQTRSCRVENSFHWPHQPLRILAPVFDFFNHDFSPNARFALEETSEGEQHLVVRLLCDLEAGTQVLIDYGDSARPAWKCLSSYGFVPTHGQDMASLGEDEDDDDQQQQHVAEVFMDGIRYEVGPNSIPEDMVVGMISSSHGGISSLPETVEEVSFTPEVATLLARRISDAAFHLLTDPPEFDDCDDDDDYACYTPKQIISQQMASSLRWNQHRILLACSLGLREWAATNSMLE